MIGEFGYRIERPPEDPGLAILAEILMKQYSPEHEVVVYEAAQYPVCDPVLYRVRLAELPEAPVTPLSTLYVAPRRTPEAQSGNDAPPGHRGAAPSPALIVHPTPASPPSP